MQSVMNFFKILDILFTFKLRFRPVHTINIVRRSHFSMISTIFKSIIPMHLATFTDAKHKTNIKF